MVKIIISGHLPKGWVCVLIMSYSNAGILALLLVDPIKDQSNNQWVSIFSRLFYIALLPLVALLFVAIGVRIGTYGVTENRYYIVVTGLWLLAIATYFILSKAKNIKVISVSLCIVGLLTLFGPWSTFIVSTHSQASRLERLFNKYKIKPETMQVANITVDSFDYKQVSGILDFFISRDELPSIQKLFPGVDLERTVRAVVKKDSLTFSINKGQYHVTGYDRQVIRDTLLACLHLKDRTSYPSYVDYELDGGDVDTMDINGFSTALKLYYNSSLEFGDDSLKFKLNNKQYAIEALCQNRILRIDCQKETVATIDLQKCAWFVRYSGNYKSNRQNIAIAFKGKELSGKIYIKNIVLRCRNTGKDMGNSIYSFNGWLLVK